ncbi:MarR family transcriptional regulator [Saccharopolyspora taberi]|uniref:MarR family transcriptional regulator n=1 Tax=Saccharopolyspora taberi TaxID=60895 RepID=A0ABN3VPX3_9PSEU
MTTDRSATDEENDRWCMAVRLLGRIEAGLDRTLQRRHGLPLSEYRALCALALAADEGGLRMHELAERIGLKESSATRLVMRLERDKLTTRAQGGKDLRGVYARITEEGRLRYAEATPTYRAALGAELDEAAGNPYLAALATWIRDA